MKQKNSTIDVKRPYFRLKGRYKDGRKRVVIEWREGVDIKSFAIPKPEKTLEIIRRSILDNKTSIKRSNYKTITKDTLNAQ